MLATIPHNDIPAKLRFALLILSALLAAAIVHSAEIIDLDDPAAIIPEIITGADSPVYITNTNGGGGGGTADSLRVGDGAALHIGYDPVDTALATTDIVITDDMTVEGSVMLGKLAGRGPGVPDQATDQAIFLYVGGDLLVSGGSFTAVAGSAGVPADIGVAGAVTVDNRGALFLEGADTVGGALLAASSANITDGYFGLGPYARASIIGTGATIATPSVVVGAGGVLELGGGQPIWGVSLLDEVPGLDLFAADGTGLAVERGGSLRAASTGGFILGGIGQILRVEAGGLIDASDGGLSAADFDEVYLGGNYLAGYNAVTGVVNHLDAYDSTVTLAEKAAVALTRDLQRAFAGTAALTRDNAAILRGGEIVFEAGYIPVLKTGMGEYHLAIGQDPTDFREALWVERVVGGVVGDGSAEDRGQFRGNLGGLWNNKRTDSQFSDNIYHLAAVETPSVVAVNDAGQLNKDILEAFVNGPNQPIDERHVADGGLYEMYNGSPAFGLNSVAYNTVSEVVATIGERLNRTDSDFAAAEPSSDRALAFLCGTPEYRENRFWVGGFGRSEEADLDYGIAGYKYRPSGFALGYDRAFGALTLGGAATYGRGNYEDKAATANNSKITSYSASVYGAYRHWTGFKAAAYGVYSHLDNDIRDSRGGYRRNADHDSYAWALGAKIGYEVKPADRLTVTPSVGLSRIRAVNEAHHERLDDLSVLNVGEVRRNSTLLPFDLQLGFELYRTDVTRFELTTNFGYAYDFDDGGVFGDINYEGLQGATGVSVAKRDPGKHRFNFGAGVVWSGSRFDLTAKYDYFRRADHDAHQVKGNLGLKF